MPGGAVASGHRAARLLRGLILFNLLAWAPLAWLAARVDLAVVSMGALAYFFGLRHAFDADHIAAIDNVTRKLRQDGQRPVATGLFFALGHSTIVILMSLFVALAIRVSRDRLGLLAAWGGLFGTLVSAGFLTLIGLVNLVIFKQLWDTFRAYQAGRRTEGLDAQVEALLARRGLTARVFGFVYRSIDADWKMYPVGVLFGLGFDTATEVAILGISATAAASGRFPLWGVMVFPLLFTAGMTLMDTLDGMLMMRVYDWAYSDPLKRLLFNTTITGLSVIVALAIGAIEWLQLLTAGLHLRGPFWTALEALDFSDIGLIIVALMLMTWLLVYRRYRRAAAPAR